MSGANKKLKSRLRAFRHDAAVSALAIVIGLGAIAKAIAETDNNPAPLSPTASTKIPEIVVTAPKTKPKPKVARQPPTQGTAAAAANAPTAAQAALDAKMTGFNQARDNLLPNIGATFHIVAANRPQEVLSTFLLGFGVGQFVMGPLSDRFGRRPALLSAA